ncbi:Zn(II)2Cys6 transcription factor [Aspergillus nomiae NRRL 13137]|uniref:Zn(II)2Cys6 transcription factor n=1 Tax=Aspergillus nomiae NRRL (strain ATCC 15546 / NRRL 13137 / CBS 260.88 / M93) TaxID=1509407 RepID=A0A0L1J4Z3_ASPN3|nr:Zn(II)2Cys6 transcription factor [Aspergillus nomiae NRRL 13137]KNG86881.1 Zn(II)2Cys6 transcription factor [Aspergillus nomiae NRRL 13137]
MSACRAIKTRCDGQNPCTNCYNNRRECRYRPSRRGGARKGNAFKARKRAIAATDTPSPSLPSGPIETQGLPYPFTNIQDVRDLSASDLASDENSNPAFELGSLAIRAYGCEADLVNAYYVFIHPYFPVLPPPAVAQYEDRPFAISLRTVQANQAFLPYWPTSPFALALSALLVLFPLPEDPHSMSEAAVRTRQSYAELYAHAAMSSIENWIDVPEPATTAGGPTRWSSLHPDLPRKLESILALVLLGMYELCQRGNFSKMRARANQALTTAVDLSLHTTDPDEPGCSDAQSRAWWMTMFLNYHSSILNNSSPIILINDPRISTPYPVFRGCLEPWPLLAKAQDTLLRTCNLAKELEKEDSRSSQPPTLIDRIRELNSLISSLAADSDRYRCVTNRQGAECFAPRNLWAITSALIHSARIRLHRFRAFLDHPLFLGEHCGLTSINRIDFLNISYPLSPSRITKINATFPFTEQESAAICLKSSLAVSRVFRNLTPPNLYYTDAPADSEALPGSSLSRFCPRSLPYMACCQMQSFYALTMLLRRVRTSLSSGDLQACYHLLSQPEPGSEVQDAERLVEELRHGLESLSASMRADIAFEGVVGMVREVEGVCFATLS